jgi:serine-type D-Ala-D-Ala carboxypeptidase (penicillin-binding protein 5/6)
VTTEPFNCINNKGSLFSAVKNPCALTRIIRTFIVFNIILACIMTCLPCAEALGTPDTSAQAVILIEARGGTVLYEKNADNPMLIASTTKILTALIVLTHCDVNENVVIKRDFSPVEGSSMYLKPGEKLTVRDLLYGLLLASGNDAAAALALHVSGSLEAFALLMNEQAKELGCQHSHFVNPHGLDQEGHYSSARDLSLIASAAMKNKTFCEIVSTKHIAVAGRSFKNHNKLLWNCPGTIGIKTGFTESAGRSLVSCAERGGMRLICVTLSAPNDWNDHTNLYSWAFNEFGCYYVSVNDCQYGRILVISGSKSNVSVHPAENFVYVYPHSGKTELKQDIKKFVYAPVLKNEKTGMLTIINNGKIIKEIPLISGEAVRLDKSVPLSFFEMLKWSILHQRKLPVIHYSYYIY